MPRDIHKSLELLEEYHAELFRPTDGELRFCIEKVIGIFKTNLFNALCDIQEFYDNVLLNRNLSLSEKVVETRRFAERWEQRRLPIGLMPVSAYNYRGDDSITSSMMRSRQALGAPSLALSRRMPQQFSATNAGIPSSFLQTSTTNRIVDEFNREWEVEEVLVDASQVGLGFSISGGRDREPEPDFYIRVTDILPGGAVARDGRIRVGDVILRVNDVDVASADHQTAVLALQKAGAFVRLLVKRLKAQRSQSQPRLNEVHPQPQRAPQTQGRQRAFSGGAADVSAGRSPSFHTLPRQMPVSQPQQQQPSPRGGNRTAPSQLSNHSGAVRYAPQPPAPESANAARRVTLLKSEGGLGFNIVGGEDNEPIYVSHVVPGGVADISGNVKKGDVLLRVNDVDLQGASHAQAAFALKSIPPNSYARILLQYRPRGYHEFEDKVIQLQNDLRRAETAQQYAYK